MGLFVVNAGAQVLELTGRAVRRTEPSEEDEYLCPRIVPRS
jgi:hypothetical protein